MKILTKKKKWKNFRLSLTITLTKQPHPALPKIFKKRESLASSLTYKLDSTVASPLVEA